MPDMMFLILDLLPLLISPKGTKPLLNGHRFDVMQVFSFPFRKYPFAEVGQVRRSGLLRFVVRQQFGLAVVVHQIVERDQSRSWRVGIDVVP